MRKLFAITLIGLSAASAFAGLLPLDPGVGLTAFTNNTNDGYSLGRGMWFQANNNFTLNGAGFFNGFGANQGFTETLYSADSVGAALHGTMLGQFSVGSPTPGDLYNTGLFAAPVTMTAGNFYYLEVTSTSDFNTNWFYNWNGSPGPVNLGDVTILDGALGDDLGNTVSPALLLNIETVPEPASIAALAIGGLGLLRFKRRKV